MKNVNNILTKYSYKIYTLDFDIYKHIILSNNRLPFLYSFIIKNLN